MTTADNLRNNIIDKLLTITNKDYLAALNKLIEIGAASSNVVKLTKEQILLLQLSEEDIINGRLKSQDEVDKSDREWLKGL